MGLINRRRSGYEEKDLIFGTCSVRTLFKTGALKSLLSKLTLRRLMSYIYGAPILDVSRSHTRRNTVGRTPLDD